MCQRKVPTIKGGGRQSIIWEIFPENCRKMKKIGPRGKGCSLKFYFVDPPLISVEFTVPLFTGLNVYMSRSRWGLFGQVPPNASVFVSISCSHLFSVLYRYD